MPSKEILHFRDGSTAAIDSNDVPRILREHSDEWSQKPFSEAVQKASQADAEKMRDHLDQMASEGKSEREIERARHAWEGAKKWKAGSKSAAAPAAVAVELKAPLEAREKGHGWWAVFDADGNQVGKNIREDDGKAFNDFSDEEKLEHAKIELLKD